MQFPASIWPTQGEFFKQAKNADTGFLTKAVVLSLRNVYVLCCCLESVLSHHGLAKPNYQLTFHISYQVLSWRSWCIVWSVSRCFVQPSNTKGSLQKKQQQKNNKKQTNPERRNSRWRQSRQEGKAPPRGASAPASPAFPLQDSSVLADLVRSRSCKLAPTPASVQRDWELITLLPPRNQLLLFKDQQR